jgi:trigger factor
MPIPADAFREQAEKRVRLGLLVGEIVRRESLQAKPDQIRRQIEEFAQAYENPAEVVRAYFSDRERLAEVEALVVEQNVVDWLLARARVNDVALSFDDLMAQAAS